MKLFNSIVLLAISFSCRAQTNLICNPSFESVNAEVFNGLNNGSTFYPDHFFVSDQEGLFDCWHRQTVQQPGNASSMAGLSFGFIPNFFPVTNNTATLFEPPAAEYTSGTDPDYNHTPPRVLQGIGVGSGSSYFTLAQNPSDAQEWGMDLSPPTSKFGENVTAVDGSNYVGLIDIHNTLDTRPNIFTRLKYPLVKDVRYTFILWWAKMNLIGQVAGTDSWDDVAEGRLKVWVADEDFNHKQLIFRSKVDNNDWSSYNDLYDNDYINFVADHDHTHLFIEFDPVDFWDIAWFGDKIAGVFIDNLKLYEACETPDIQCVNSNYRHDLLDPKLEDATLTSPYAFPYGTIEPGGSPNFKTVRAYKLENAKHFELDIFPLGVPIPCRSISIDYPHSEYYWDGRDDNGDLMPEGHYIAIIKKVTNDCFMNLAVDTREFNLQRNYSVFDVWSSTNGIDGNTFINGLDNVHWMNVKMYTQGGGLIHEFSVNNPPSSLGLSIPSLMAFGGAQNLSVTPAHYNLVITVSNNCAEKQYGFSNANFGTISDTLTPSPFYDWSPVSKPAEFPCPFDFHYDHNVRMPMNCCEGYLHLENMEVWNSWGEVNIRDSILIGPNVVFEPGTYNYLNSGGQIQLLPDSSGVTVLGTAVFKPSTFECEICKSYTFESVPDDQYTASDRESVYANMDSLAAMRSKEMIVYPNPSSGSREITLLAGTVDIDPANYRLVLSNPLGKPVEIRVTTERRDLLRFKPKTELSPGAYYLYFESNGKQETFSVVIR